MRKLHRNVRLSGRETEAMYMNGLGQDTTIPSYISSDTQPSGSIWDIFSFSTPDQPAQDQTAATADQPVSILDKVTGTVTNLFTAYNQYQNAKMLNDLNAQRAAKGLPPLSSAQYNASLPASAAVQVNIDPAVKNALMIGGIGLGAFLLFKLVKG